MVAPSGGRGGRARCSRSSRGQRGSADLEAHRAGGAGGLAQQHRRGGRLEDERERAILEDRDLHRHDRAPLLLGGGVVGLAEVHDGDAVGAERRADRRRGRGLAGGDLDLDDGQDLLLGHGNPLEPSVVGVGALAGRQTQLTSLPRNLRFALVERGPCRVDAGQSLATLLNSSSTGVSRPKMLTSTLSLSWSSLISMTSPEKSANGPSLTRTVSPTSYSRRGLGRCAPRSSGPPPEMRNAPTSRRGSGDGLAPRPTNPVTPGVLRMTNHAWSSSCERTSR